MIVLIDDIRNLDADVILRTADAAEWFLNTASQTLCVIDMLLLDHDLGDKRATERTGYTILVKMLEKTNLRPKKIKIVSSNPVGKENMIAAAKSAGYVINYAEQCLVYTTT